MYERLQEARRPTLPLTLYALVSCVAVGRMVLVRNGGLGREYLRAVLLACAMIAGCALLALRRTRNASVAGTMLIVAISCALGVLRAQATAERMQFCASFLGTHAVSTLGFTVTGESSKTAYGYRCEATAVLDGRDIGTVWLRGKRRLTCGTRVQCVGSFQENADDEWGERARAQGIAGTIRVGRMLKEEPPSGMLGTMGALREQVISRIGPSATPARALLAGCVCGWRDDLQDFELDDLCSRCGIAHLVAVSGSHLAIITSLVAAVLLKLHCRPWQRVVVLMLFGGSYVVFCGMPVSAIRAWLMSNVAYVGMVCGRRAHGLSGACMVGTAMTLWDPAVTGQVGFLLSVTSVIALGIFAPYATIALKVLVGVPPRLRFLPRRVTRTLRGLLSGVEESLAASVVASVATLPLTAHTFGTCSIVGPLCNAVIALPFSAFVCLGMVAVALQGVPGLGHLLLGICDRLGELILGVANEIGGLPHAEVSTAGVVTWLGPVVLLGAIALLVVWPRPNRRRMLLAMGCVVLAGVAWIVRGRYMAPTRVCVLDVGQGDAVLVQDGPHALLVDTGPGDAVVEALARNNVWQLDAALVTHLHADHYEGLLHLKGACACDNVIVARGVAESVPSELHDAMKGLTGKDPLELGYGDVLRVGRFTLHMVWPTVAVDGDQNAESIELVLEFDDGTRTLTGLLTGDAETNELAALIENGDVGNIDVLKVGHHGSEVSLTPEQACAIDPEVSVASAGEGNKYGHPTHECVSALEAAESAFFCTKDVGDVEIRPGKDGPEVRVAHPDGLL